MGTFFFGAFSFCFANTLIMTVKFSLLGKRAHLLLYFFVFPRTHMKRLPPLCGFVVETMLLATHEQPNISITWRPAGLWTQPGLQKCISRILTSSLVKSRCSNVRECKHDNMRFLLYRRLCALLLRGQTGNSLPDGRLQEDGPKLDISC